ncbi:M48 family metalloprotease [Streptacidiphilus rugosus]|uniref:M48 family metalloprotease n=1 Tax=Streptacidiphilus rugosus TaxID=405783 RepID=UPI00056ABAEF|nr:M48 family metallopeptidase [Streptacidiphilus rugosus]
MPDAQRTAPSPTGRSLRRRLDESLEQRLFQEAVSGPGGLRRRADLPHVLAWTLALPVHLLTLAALGGVVVLLAADVWTADIAALALLGVAWVGRPRLGSMRAERRKSLTVSREAAPQLWSLMDAVAAELGTRGPDLVVVDRRFNASYARVGLRRRVVLRIGLPLWVSLDEQERVALLAHEFGHGVNGDVRRGLWLGVALSSLAEWWYFLTPSPGRVRVRIRGGLDVLFTLVAETVQRLLAVLAELYHRLLHWLTRHGSRRAEYLADSFMVRLAGPGGAAGLVEALRLGTAFETLVQQRTMAARRPVQRSRSRRNEAAGGAEPASEVTPPDLWTQLGTYVRSIPAEERTRRIVASQLRHDDFDGTHPPAHLRLAYVRSLPEGEPAVVLDPAASEAIDAELRPAGVSIAAELIRR